MKLSVQTYLDPDPVRIARFLLGRFLMVRSSEGVCGGMITETEAYGGSEDKACHGYANRRTARTEIMFAPGGRAYVYLCYGLHEMFNIVTGPAEVPQAVLIRSVEITDGEALVAARRKGIERKNWANGPGRVTVALGIHRKFHNTLDLTGDTIWVEDRRVVVTPKQIIATPRIGVNYAGAWAKKPWRFVLKND
jgi:DNA-3-methyladenine glycosylase